MAVRSNKPAKDGNNEGVYTRLDDLVRLQHKASGFKEELSSLAALPNILPSRPLFFFTPDSLVA